MGVGEDFLRGPEGSEGSPRVIAHSDGLRNGEVIMN